MLFRKAETCEAEAIRELQRQGAAAIHIAVAKENIPAQKLYRKMASFFAVKPICTDTAISCVKEY